MLYMTFTRYEVRGCEYPHSGFVCGGAEWMDKHASHTEYMSFIDIIYDLGENEEYGISPPIYSRFNPIGRNGDKMLCFFTNEGLHRCEPIISKMLDLLRKNGAIIDTMRYVVKIPVTDPNLAYRDQYQAVIYIEE